MPELERSPEFERKLEGVRRMPQSFGAPGESADEQFAREKQSAEKREAVRLLRMETLLDNAKCARFLVEALEDDPKITVEELSARVAREANVIHPEVVEAFCAELVATSERVAQTIGDLKQESGKKKIGMAKLLYRRLLTNELRNPKRGQPRLPQGEVKLGGEYPLSVQLDVMDDADYLAIRDERLVRATRPEDLKLSGGYQKAVAKPDSLAAMLEESAGNKIDFPVIVVRPSTGGRDTPQVKRHERGHAQHEVFESALETKGKKFVWGEPEWDAGVDNRRLQELWKEDEDKARNSVYWKRIQEKAVACAKREFFADMTAGEGDRLDASSINRLQYGHYDYFIDFGIEPGSSLHVALRQEYLQMLESASGRVANVIRGYSVVGLNERVELMRWVAAQMPLREWSSQLNAANFQWEANRLRRIARFYSDGLRGDDEIEKGRRQNLMHDMLEEMKRMQDKPLGEVLSRYERYFNIPEAFV